MRVIVVHINMLCDLTGLQALLLFLTVFVLQYFLNLLIIGFAMLTNSTKAFIGSVL